MEGKAKDRNGTGKKKGKTDGDEEMPLAKLPRRNKSNFYSYAL